MNIKLEKVSPEDAAGLSQVMMRAFYRDPHWRLLWGSMTLEDIIVSCENRLPRNLVKGRGSRRHRKAVDAVTGEVVGYARWVLPEGQEDLWKDAQVAEPSAQQAALYEARYSAYTVDGKIKGLNNEITESLSPLLEKTEEDILKTGTFLALDYIAVLPDRQQQGIGSILVEDGLRVAEKAGLRVYVMSTQTGLKLYQGHGFISVRTVEQDDSQWGSTEPHINYFLVKEKTST
ncbi:Putative GNAT domain, acyl-CoA N-acyltransferase [Colletotrichum destructivum]|uniref:GNAT domain, acyl-CoA N-acyltransferase n=1 Tax=Colletotrichum destructivum TaxID=34406 RepID=A0AAX4IDS2_9PEZI|nr:Putative GNAT domain, acyl-CoA N-acyltransferase [Colletotrichum destructivum]